MQVEARDIELLLELQGLDLKIMKINRQRAELPQRERMGVVKKRRAEFSEKLEQVLALLEKARKELETVEAEDASLQEKQKKAQELIDAAGTDFRRVESHSKEMGGFAKRRETLSAKSDELAAYIQNAESIQFKVENGLATLDAEAEAIRASFAEEDGKLAEELAQVEAERTATASNVSAEALALYQKTAERTGGVAIGHLTENSCGVCRSLIDGGRLIELRTSAPLGVCPSCKRLLVID